VPTPDWTLVRVTVGDSGVRIVETSGVVRGSDQPEPAEAAVREEPIGGDGADPCLGTGPPMGAGERAGDGDADAGDRSREVELLAAGAGVARVIGAAPRSRDVELRAGR
jgi:hypothetical protein